MNNIKQRTKESVASALPILAVFGVLGLVTYVSYKVYATTKKKDDDIDWDNLSIQGYPIDE